MTVTHFPPGAAVTTAPHPDTLRFAAGLVRLAVWLKQNPGAPAPTPVMNIPVPGVTRDEKLAALEEIAVAYGTKVTTGVLGMRIAVAEFDGVSVEAHVIPGDMAKRIIARQDAAKAAEDAPETEEVPAA